MEYFLFVFEIIGTIAFAVSGAAVGIRKSMDVFGVVVLGLTTACGGGLIRDALLGHTPPMMFSHPVYACGAIAASLAVFLVVKFRGELRDNQLFILAQLTCDSAGLGVFTVSGISAAVSAGYGGNLFFTVFLGVLTGVGGGLFRDMMAGEKPYILTKHIYATASLAGALVCWVIWRFFNQHIAQNVAMLTGSAVIVIIRFCAAYYRWSLPKIVTKENHHD